MLRFWVMSPPPPQFKSNGRTARLLKRVQLTSGPPHCWFPRSFGNWCVVSHFKLSQRRFQTNGLVLLNQCLCKLFSLDMSSWMPFPIIHHNLSQTIIGAFIDWLIKANTERPQGDLNWASSSTWIMIRFNSMGNIPSVSIRLVLCVEYIIQFGREHHHHQWIPLSCFQLSQHTCVFCKMFKYIDNRNPFKK